MICSQLNNIILKTKIKRNTTKRASAFITPAFSLLEQQNSYAKTLEVQNGNLSSFLGSLILPLAETYKYRREIKLFLNYTMDKIKKSN